MPKGVLIPCALMLFIGCSRSLDPCPPGSTLEDDRCSPVIDGGRGKPPSALRDAGALLDSRVDSEHDAAPQDAQSLQTDSTLPDGGVPDAAPDGAVFSGCSRSDVMRWNALHASSALVSTINHCILSSPACLNGSCELDSCLRERLDMRGCAACTREEVACVATYCRDECGVRASSANCRSCMCESGCAQLFEDCAGAELTICPEFVPVPPPPDAGAAGLSPELIMVVTGAGS